MQDDVKTLRERIDRAIQRITDGHGAMRVPADMTDPDIVLNACRRHIDAEPARLAAAREEQREACAQFCEEEYYDVSHSECAFADSLEAIRATPLTATPLKDRIAEAERGEQEAWRQTDAMRAERDRFAHEAAELRSALGKSKSWHQAKQKRIAELEAFKAVHGGEACRENRAEGDGPCGACSLCVQEVRTERDAALARVKKLEADVEVGRETCRRHGTTRATAADGWPASKLIGFLSHSLAGKDAAIKDAAESASQLRSERDTLKAQLAEAVGVLRALLREEWYTYEGNLEASGHASVDDLNAARAFLAKYPEGQ